MVHWRYYLGVTRFLGTRSFHPLINTPIPGGRERQIFISFYFFVAKLFFA